MDKNPLAVELSKLALWLESHAEGMPLTFLDHRMVVGDSLTGPLWDKLLFRPGKPDTPVEDLFSQGIYGKLQKVLTQALSLVRRLESSVGSDLAEVLDKEAVKAQLDLALLPFRIATAAWAGGVMLGTDKCDDLSYADLLRTIGDTGRLPEALESDHLRRQIARGLGLDDVPDDRVALQEAAASPQSVPALSYDLTFPEVFYPLGVPHGRQGFHDILGNPPWDRMLPADKEFFAGFEFAILDAPTKRERAGIQKRLLSSLGLKARYERYVSDFRSIENILDKLFAFQVVEIDEERTIGKQDAFRVFLERNAQLLKTDGWTGVVVPSAFHANEGATGIRQLYLGKMALRHCYSFENRRKLFEIHSSSKFATVVAQAGRPTDSASCAFYLHDDEWLFTDHKGREPLQYDLGFIRRTGGDYMSLLELRSTKDLEVAEACFAHGEPFGQVCERLGIRLSRELNMTDDAWRFTPTVDVLPKAQDPRDPAIATQVIEHGYLVLHEGKTFRQYDDHWSTLQRYLVSIEKLAGKSEWITCACHYRIAYREIAGPGDENVSIWSMLPPGCACGHKAPLERTPWNLRSADALMILGIANSFCFDWLLSLKVRASVGAFMRDSISVPRILASLFIPHSGARLSCNHAGYAGLWQEQLGVAWREQQKKPFSWPALKGDEERWAVRAAIDAVVADAYGLSRHQYAHVLSTFPHKRYPKAPEYCLAMFDELKAIGLDAFTKKHDPYWDIPLNENLPQPVIDLPVAEAEQSTVGDPALGSQFRLSDKPARQRAKRKR